MKRVLYRILPALFLSVLWILPFSSSANELAVILLLFAGFAVEMACPIPIIPLAGTALVALGVGLLDLRYLFFGLPTLLFPICCRTLSAGETGKNGKQVRVLLPVVFAAAVLAEWGYAIRNLSFFNLSSLRQERKIWILPVLFLYFLVKTVQAFRSGRVRTEKNGKKGLKKRKTGKVVHLSLQTVLFLIQIVSLTGVFILTAESFLPVVSCLYAPLLSTYCVLTDPAFQLPRDGIPGKAA